VVTAIHEGKLLGFTKITHDITERRQAVELLRQSDAVFRSVAENISAMLWVLDATASKCIYASPAYETIFHRSCESLYADLSSYLESVLPEDRGLAAAFLECLVRDGESDAEYRLQRADGSIRWLWTRGKAIRNAAGAIQRLAGIAEDVTDRKKAGQAATLLSSIVECCEDAIISKTLDGNVIQWNAGAVRLYGYRAEEMLGKSALILYPPDKADEYTSIMERIRQGQSIHSYQTRRRRKDGKLIDVLVAVAPLIAANNLIEGASVISHDLTETLSLQEQFRQSQKMEAVGRLAGGVAHDFNNLLTIISGYSEIVLGKLAIGDPVRELVNEIGKAGARAAALTRQLLAFSRKTVLQPSVLDLNAVITDSLKMLRRLVGEDVEVNTVLSPPLSRVKVDPSQFEQAIVNLAVNARDAMPEGGKITFETANIELDTAYCLANPAVTPGLYAMVAASDNGTGMSEETKVRIFEPFFTTKEVGKGTGLGLAMVYGFIKQSGGHIAVYSELDHGTTFKLYFPQVKDALRARPSDHGLRFMPQGTETILLVEDDDGVRALARHVLQTNGYTVLEANRGADALRLAERHHGPIHLLLTDVVMPGMGGRIVAERMAALKPGIKTVFTSGYTDDAVVRHGILESETHFLQKPYTPGAVTQKVREALDS
jgi:PAS domain S-box-containing protein